MILVSLCLVGTGLGVRWWRSRAAVRDTRRAARALPALAGALARSVRSGATLRTALEEVGPWSPGLVGEEVMGVTHALDRGRPMADVLMQWGGASAIPGVDLLAGACRFGVVHGGNLARALDGVAASALDDLEVADEVRALVSQARMSALVLVALPPSGAVVLVLVDPAVAGVLFGSVLGSACLVIGGVLDALGAWISAQIIRRVAA